MTDSDLQKAESAAPKASSKTKPMLRAVQKERDKRQAAEARATAADALNASHAQTIANLQAALAETRRQAEAELDKAAQHITTDRETAAGALAEAREAAFQFGRTVERSGIVKASTTLAQLDEASEADRRKIVDAAARAARPTPITPSNPTALDGQSLASLSLNRLGSGAGTGH